jgi:hypothetical protein
MSLQRLLDSDRLAPAATSAQEIGDLLRLVRQYLWDAQAESISADLRFTAAYQAALQLATIPLRCAGYRTVGGGRHVTVFQALPAAMGESYRDLAGYYDACRRKRHMAEYQRVGQISEAEVAELITTTHDFLLQVEKWLAAHHPTLLAE